jgi:molecular chaperone DnaJ
VYLELPITVKEAVLGGKVEVPTPEGGRARMSIPAGTQSGQRFKLRGKGFPTPGGARGDLYVDVQVVLPEQLSPQARQALEALEASYRESPRRRFFK